MFNILKTPIFPKGLFAPRSTTVVMTFFLASFLIMFSQKAHALIINPIFGSSITGNVHASLIEGAIKQAISTIEGLYANPLTISTTFTYSPASSGILLSTSEYFYDIPYKNYTNALRSVSLAYPHNTVLSTAIAYLSKGNDANGTKDMAITGAQGAMLGLLSPSASNSTININSNQNFSFTRPVPSNQFDAIGALEHELDEVLGGGGAGSTLNALSISFFANKYGSLDLYRYSAPGVPSFTTSSTATSYFSVNGGASLIVHFNQNPNGDFGDFAPPGTGLGQRIQNAFNSTGQDENYTTSSVEFLMEEAIGWSSASLVTSAETVPEPGTMMMIFTGVVGLFFGRNKKSPPLGRWMMK